MHYVTLDCLFVTLPSLGTKAQRREGVADVEMYYHFDIRFITGLQFLAFSLVSCSSVVVYLAILPHKFHPI